MVGHCKLFSPRSYSWAISIIPGLILSFCSTVCGCTAVYASCDTCLSGFLDEQVEPAFQR